MKNWIATALLKRKEKYSTVIVLETSDPERGRELSEYLRMCEEVRTVVRSVPAGESVKGIRRRLTEKLQGLTDDDIRELAGDRDPRTLLLYDPFEGLSNLQTGKAFSFKGDKDSLLGPLATSMMGLQTVLGIVDKQMRLKGDEGQTIGRTTLIVKNVGERHHELAAAVRSWATSQITYSGESTVFILAPSAEGVLDDYSLGLVAVVPVPISEAWERETLIRKACPEADSETVQRAVVATSGLDLHGTESAVLESIYTSGELNPVQIAGFKSDVVRKCGPLEIVEPTVGFGEVGGYKKLKEFVRENIISVLKAPSRSLRFGLRLPRGLLFFGPPGTGKSLFARALSRELGLTFIALKTENIFASLVGESEHRMKTALKVAEAISPACLYMDEIDRMGKRTDISTDSGTAKRVFSALLEYLGDASRKSLIIGTTNLIEELDDAFIRSGRFDYKIPFLFPDEGARLEILRVHTSGVRQIPLKDVDLETVARKTDCFSGSELEELALRAARKAFIHPRAQSVTQGDFEAALKDFRIDLDARRSQIERYKALSKKFTDDVSFLED